MPDIQALLRAGLTQLGLSPDTAPQLERYGQLLTEKNQVMNLTAITDPVEVAQKHMLDCAALLGAARFQGKSVIDVGSGAGFPGLVLKLCEGSIDLTLLDSLQKRVDWLEEAAQALGVSVTALHGRAEELGKTPELREQFDIATARAVADLRILCELCLPLVKVGGRVPGHEGGGLPGRGGRRGALHLPAGGAAAEELYLSGARHGSDPPGDPGGKNCSHGGEVSPPLRPDPKSPALRHKPGGRGKKTRRSAPDFPGKTLKSRAFCDKVALGK